MANGEPTAESVAMASVVAACAPLLKERGFTKRRHSFNSATTHGIVRVVNFWMAPFEPPAWTEVPGLRESRYGSFRVDFGVWVPQMNRMGEGTSAWVNEYDCDLRATAGQLIDPNSGADLWWDLKRGDAAALALDALERYGLPWLDRFSTQEAILAEFESNGPLGLGMTPAGGLDIADLYAALGRPNDARRTLEHYVAAPVLVNHADYLAEYLRSRGHADLVERIMTRFP